MIITTGRPVTMARKGMVATPHALATATGVDILRAGGSAVDAMIASAAVLAVVYPHMTGVGGDAFWLIHDAKTGKIRYLNGGGRAARSATIDTLKDAGHTKIPDYGIIPATITVPGAISSWFAAHREYGRLEVDRLLSDAIAHARDGFPASERVAARAHVTAERLSAHRASAKIFLPGGTAPTKGDVLKNLDLANTLEAISADGADGFYKGKVGTALARFSKQFGGLFDQTDLANQQARWGEPICATYRGITIYNTPPPTQGVTMLEMANMLEGTDLGHLSVSDPARLHALIQAKQIAYADRDALLADPDFADVPVEQLISPAYARERASLMNAKRALQWDEVPNYGSTKGDTVYLCAIDNDGNAVSLIHSLYHGFGSGVVADGTGVLLQNRGSYFSLDPQHPNRLEPGKIPMHTLMASIAKRDGKLWGAMGCMGGDGQPQIQMQVYSALIDHGLDIQEALEAPRFIAGKADDGQERHVLNVEDRFGAATLEELAKRGHDTIAKGDWNELMGHAHGIFVDPETDVLTGGADPRSDGAAMGY